MTDLDKIKARFLDMTIAYFQKKVFGLGCDANHYGNLLKLRASIRGLESGNLTESQYNCVLSNAKNI